MFPTAVIRARICDIDTDGQEIFTTLIIVKRNCPITFVPDEWVVTSNKRGQKTTDSAGSGAGVCIDTTPPETAFADGEWVRIYNTNAGTYGLCHDFEEAATSFGNDGWVVYTPEEAQCLYPWSTILEFED